MANAKSDKIPNSVRWGVEKVFKDDHKDDDQWCNGITRVTFDPTTLLPRRSDLKATMDTAWSFLSSEMTDATVIFTKYLENKENDSSVFYVLYQSWDGCISLITVPYGNANFFYLHRYPGMKLAAIRRLHDLARPLFDGPCSILKTWNNFYSNHVPEHVFSQF